MSSRVDTIIMDDLEEPKTSAEFAEEMEKIQEHLRSMSKEERTEVLRGAYSGQPRNKAQVTTYKHFYGDPDRVTAVECKESIERLDATVLVTGITRIAKCGLLDYMKELVKTKPVIIDIEDEIFNLTYVAQRVRTIAEVSMLALAELTPTERKYYKGGFAPAYPVPKHINARQAWKNRCKTSKRKGTRKGKRA